MLEFQRNQDGKDRAKNSLEHFMVERIDCPRYQQREQVSTELEHRHDDHPGDVSGDGDRRIHAGKDSYAGLQAAGAVTTLVILFFRARIEIPQRILGGLAYSMIAAGALISALSPNLTGYVLGFLLIVGYDKIFNIYMRSIRQRVIPAKDFGKTVGVITLRDNLSPPWRVCWWRCWPQALVRKE